MCYSCTLRLVVWDIRCHLAIFFFALSYKWFLLLLWRMSNKKGDMTTSWRRWTQTTSRQAAVWQITILQKKSLWAVQFAVKLNIKEREWHSVYFKQPYTATLPSSILWVVLGVSSRWDMPGTPHLASNTIHFKEKKRSSVWSSSISHI